VNQKWHILFCDNHIEICPVSDFIDRCPNKHQVKILRFLKLLEEMGPNLPRPYADLLDNGIHELRIRLSGEHVRVLYFFCYRKFIVLYYAFAKHTSRVPEKAVRKVIKYRSDLLDRVDHVQMEKWLNADA